MAVLDRWLHFAPYPTLWHYLISCADGYELLLCLRCSVLVRMPGKRYSPQVKTPYQGVKGVTGVTGIKEIAGSQGRRLCSWFGHYVQGASTQREALTLTPHLLTPHSSDPSLP